MSFSFPPAVLTAEALSSPDYDSFLKNIAKDRILIVDDEPSVRKLFVGCLSDRYECGEAGTTKEALAMLAETEYALVITDMIMPGLSGIELLRKVVELYPYTGVIMVSGINQPQRALDAVRSGAFDYLIKPCDLDVLELTVERALERRTLLSNARQYKIDLELRNSELAREKTKLERLQAQIIHSEKMASLGQLAAGIAHELNNPVGFICGNMGVLSECVGDLKDLLEYYDSADSSAADSSGAAIKERIDYDATLADLDSIIKDCYEGARRIRDIVQNLRTFSRLDHAADCKESDVHEGIDSTVRLLSRYYSSDNITLVRDYGELPPVEAFAGQLNQVWMNLLVNAAQAVSVKGGEVRIKTRAFEDSVVVTVADTGVGIPNESLHRIFEPFYTTKPVGEGTGLGLSISFGIVERHNGKIEVATRIGEGTSFTVRLPVRVNKDFFAKNSDTQN